MGLLAVILHEQPAREWTCGAYSCSGMSGECFYAVHVAGRPHLGSYLDFNPGGGLFWLFWPTHKRQLVHVKWGGPAMCWQVASTMQSYYSTSLPSFIKICRETLEIQGVSSVTHLCLSIQKLWVPATPCISVTPASWRLIFCSLVGLISTTYLQSSSPVGPGVPEIEGQKSKMAAINI